MACEERRSILLVLGAWGSGSVDGATVALGEAWCAAGWRVTFAVFGAGAPEVLRRAAEGAVAKALPLPARSVGNVKALRALLAAREVSVVGEPWRFPRGVGQALREAARGLDVRVARGFAAHAAHRLSAERWRELGRYHDLLPRWVKRRRLVWFFCEALLLRPWPYFVGNGFRRWLLRRFGARVPASVSVQPSVRVWAPWNLLCGEDVAIDRNVRLYSVAPITLGSKIALSDGAFLCTASHDISSAARPLTVAPITVGDGAWIGAEAFIHPGVTVGEGAVVAARAVVIKDVPPFAVVAGNPAKVIKQRTLRECAQERDDGHQSHSEAHP